MAKGGVSPGRRETAPPRPEQARRARPPRRLLSVEGRTPIVLLSRRRSSGRLSRKHCGTPSRRCPLLAVAELAWRWERQQASLDGVPPKGGLLGDSRRLAE